MLLAACPLPSFSGQSPAISLPELPEGLPAMEDRAHMAAFRPNVKNAIWHGCC